MNKAVFKKLLWRVPVYSLLLAGIPLFGFWQVVRPPKMNSRITPAEYRLPSQDVTLMTSDGLKLAAWFIPSVENRSSERAIILVHGYPSEKTDMLGMASFLHADFDLLLFDLRYFGKSEGSYTTLGIKERRDLKAALDFLETRGYRHIGVLGFSLGGAVTLLTAAEDRRIDAVVSYAAFSDAKVLGLETYAGLGILTRPMVSLMLLWGRVLFGESLATTSPINAAPEITVPVFIIHSRADDQVPVHHGEGLRKVLKKNSRSEFYFPARGLHGEPPPDFDRRVRDFFLTVLDKNDDG